MFYSDFNFFKYVILIAGWLLMITFIIRLEYKKDEKVYNNIEAKIDSGYCLYLDGNEADPDKVCIEIYDLYNIHVDDEKKAVYITIGKGRDKIEIN